MPGKAPVEAVGGTVDTGPWPSEVDEIVEGNTYDRVIRLGDGSVTTAPVTVTRVENIVRKDGTATDGYVVAFSFDDPSLGGGT